MEQQVSLQCIHGHFPLTKNQGVLDWPYEYSWSPSPGCFLRGIWRGKRSYSPPVRTRACAKRYSCPFTSFVTGVVRLIRLFPVFSNDHNTRGMKPLFQLTSQVVATMVPHSTSACAFCVHDRDSLTSYLLFLGGHPASVLEGLRIKV